MANRGRPTAAKGGRRGKAAPLVARLRRELADARAREAATAAIIRALSGSSGDPRRVFDVILESATRLCDAHLAVLNLYENEMLRTVAQRGGAPAFVKWLYDRGPFKPPHGLKRMIRDRRTVQYPDLKESPEYRAGIVHPVKFVKLGRARTYVTVPLVKGRRVLGAVAFFRPEVRPFTPRQIALLEGFAAQALTAIENARLVRELRASDERYNIAMRAINEAVYDWDIANDRFTPSASMSKLLGLPQEPLGLRNWQKAVHPEDYPRFRETTVAHLKGRTKRFECDYRYRAADGAWHWARTHGVAIRDAKGRAVRMVGATGRIDELKKAELELQRSHRETAEALERQTATAEILKVIARSPSDVRPVFDAIVQSARRLLGGHSAMVTRRVGDFLHFAAATRTNRQADELLRKSFPRPLSQRGLSQRAVRRREVVIVEDVKAQRGALGINRRLSRLRGFRSAIGVPLMQGKQAIGGISVTRREPGPFTAHQIELLQTFADQAVIAIENVRLFNETREALEQQTAISEVLRVISASPTDVKPVLEAVATRAARICDASDARIFLVEGGQFRYAAGFGDTPVMTHAFPVNRDSPSGRAVLELAPIQIEDIEAESSEEYAILRELARRSGWRTALAVPLTREKLAFGTIALRRKEVRPFSEKQIELLRTFADQAAIAIENVRLFNETRESLERQTATAEILKVIASSPSDVQPVFEAIVQSGLKLFSDAAIGISIPDGDKLQTCALAGADPVRAKAWRDTFPVPLRREYMIGAAILDKRVVDVADCRDAPPDLGLGARNLDAMGYRAQTVMPMMRGDMAIGTISVIRVAPGPLSPEQLALLKTFTDQAVIAFENVRLFNETKEALARQTATSNVLREISRSTFDLDAILQTLLDNAMRLCSAVNCAMFLKGADGGFRLASMVRNAPDAPNTPALEKALRDNPIQPGTDTTTGRALLERRTVHTRDIRSEPGYRPDMVAYADYRTNLAVPMLRDGEVMGAITLTRGQEVSPFTDKQIELVEGFSAQAVIAIENVRLFNETREALERQTATAEILNVISRSPTDVQPVFDTIVRSAIRLMDGVSGGLFIADGVQVQIGAAFFGSEDRTAGFRADYPAPIDYNAPAVQAIRESRVLNVADLLEGDYSERVKERARSTPYRSALNVPMLRGGRAIGSIGVTRAAPGLFPENHVTLLKTFADQAVIAIENVRLFKELQQRVGQLTALGEVGQAISSTLELETVLRTIVQHAVKLTGLDGGSIYEYDERTEEFRLQAGENMAAELVEEVRRAPVRKGEGAIGTCAVTREPVLVPDIEDPGFPSARKEVLVRAGYRAILAVPLLREDHMLGALQVFRNTPGAFAPEVVELLKTFATQSAMAIQNARLFREIAEKGRQLEEASQHKSNFLASMSHELRTPLNAILGLNEMLLGQIYGEVPADMQPPLAQIQTSGKHLLRLINNVLDLAKIEAGRMELSLSDYSVQDTVASVQSTLSPLAAEKGLEFLANAPNDIPLAYGDGGRITQCLMNLAGNSLKFTKAGRVEISVAEQDGLLTYRVADTGIGIPPDKIGSLFTEFKQTDATIASEYGGTGLGLSISRKFVEMHGGRIWAESEPGKGSAFIFEIPLRVGTS